MKIRLDLNDKKTELEKEGIELLKHPKMVGYQNHFEILQNAVRILDDKIKGLDL
ncbi:hypothetical protein HET73_07000, partial [Wolbachia endosymbiont of Atemnus politus]|nr:hypothetical protein [Wolbachia endosymbiont of Atemnus politus]